MSGWGAAWHEIISLPAGRDDLRTRVEGALQQASGHFRITQACGTYPQLKLEVHCNSSSVESYRQVAKGALGQTAAPLHYIPQAQAPQLAPATWGTHPQVHAPTQPPPPWVAPPRAPPPPNRFQQAGALDRQLSCGARALLKAVLGNPGLQLDNLNEGDTDYQMVCAPGLFFVPKHAHRCLCVNCLLLVVSTPTRHLLDTP